MAQSAQIEVFFDFFLRFFSKILLSLTRLHYETTFKTHMDAFFIPIFKIETLEFSDEVVHVMCCFTLSHH